MNMVRKAVAGAVMAVAAAGQGIQMDFTALAEKAKSKTEVSLDRAMLQSARAVIPQADRLAGIDAVSVHVYEYAKAGDYPESAVEALVRQVEQRPDWKRVVVTRDGGEHVEVFLKTEAETVVGLLVVAAEARQVAVVEATGKLELAKLQEVVQSTVKFDMAGLMEQAGK